MISPLVAVQGMICVLLTGHQAHVSAQQLHATHPMCVRSIVDCATPVGEEVWFLGRPDKGCPPVQVECLQVAEDKSKTSVPCEGVTL